jgi:hypothetical protein
MIALWIILYVVIACVIGCFLYVQWEGEEDREIGVLFASVFWPAAIIVIILYFILVYVCSKLVSFFRYLKTEGLHYCKDNIEPCCGQCKYMYYCNNHNELSGCRLYKGHTHLSSTSIHCEQFKKHWLWRFRIRYKWDDKS